MDDINQLQPALQKAIAHYLTSPSRLTRKDLEDGASPFPSFAWMLFLERQPDFSAHFGGCYLSWGEGPDSAIAEIRATKRPAFLDQPMALRALQHYCASIGVHCINVLERDRLHKFRLRDRAWAYDCVEVTPDQPR